MGRSVLDNPVWLRNSRGIVAQPRQIDISRRILGTILYILTIDIDPRG